MVNVIDFFVLCLYCV